MPMDSLMNIEEFVPFAEGLDHPEGVAWGPDGSVYAGGEAGQVYRVDLEKGGYEQIACTGGFTLGVTLDANLNIYTCDPALHKVMKITPKGEIQVYSEGSSTRKFLTPNYSVFDRDGNLYVSDSGEFQKNNGCLVCIRRDGSTEVISEKLPAFPNGMALSPAGDELYVVLSTWPGVVKVRLLGEGRVGDPQTVVELPGTVPDGLAFDSAGNLLISCYAPNYIYRLSPADGLALLVSDWMNVTLPAPTNIAFCGPDLQTLVAAGLSRWHLSKARMSVPGLPLIYPKL
jgi:gluconolactonase